MRRAWTSSVASQVGEEAHRRRRVRVGERRAREVEQLGAVLGPEAAQLQAFERRRDRRAGAGRPSWRCPCAWPGRSRRGSGARGARAPAPCVDRRRRPEPVLGERVEVGAAPLPRARRRHADEVEPEADAVRGGRLPSSSRSPCAAAARPASAPRSAAPRRPIARRLAASSARSHQSRRAARTATRAASSRRARRGGSSPRISVAWTTARRSSARVSASRSKPSTRDHSPMYIDGAYWACSPPIASSVRGIGGARVRAAPGGRAAPG